MHVYVCVYVCKYVCLYVCVHEFWDSDQGWGKVKVILFWLEYELPIRPSTTFYLGIFHSLKNVINGPSSQFSLAINGNVEAETKHYYGSVWQNTHNPIDRERPQL